jgi:hypothetical protein
MRRDSEDRPDPRQPALIVRYGNTKRKHWPLDRDLVVLGRSAGCDLGLLSAEVAPVHCLLIRTGAGWRIRDCTGRSATRLNGQAIEERPLVDGDIIQVGTFSFEVNLPLARSAPTAPPAPAAPAAPAPPEKRRLEQSRRNLARHALRLRKRLLGLARAEAELTRRQADLEQQEDRLRAACRSFEARRAQLEQEQHARADQQPTPSAEAPAAGPDEAALERRRQELDHYADHLRRLARRLEGQEGRSAAEPGARREEVDQLLRQVRQRKADREERGREAEAQLLRQRAQLAQERAELDRLRAEPQREETTPQEGQVRSRLLKLLAEKQASGQAPNGPGKGPRSRQLRALQPSPAPEQS